MQTGGGTNIGTITWEFTLLLLGFLSSVSLNDIMLSCQGTTQNTFIILPSTISVEKDWVYLKLVITQSCQIHNKKTSICCFFYLFISNIIIWELSRHKRITSCKPEYWKKWQFFQKSTVLKGKKKILTSPVTIISSGFA